MPKQIPQPRKYLKVYAALRRDIESGRWKEGEQLPSEAELVRSFGVSRITVTRAVNDLQHAGLVQRIAGSGTFVTRPGKGQSFGMLMPDLGEAEIFEQICRGMLASPLAQEHALLWGSTASKHDSQDERAWNLCRQYIARGVSGVFFAPLELTALKDQTNRRILRALNEERIPVVLLDRAAVPYPESSEHDLVGIDNRRAGCVVTTHLVSCGCRRIAFLAMPNAAPSVDERQAGYREALFCANVHYDGELNRRMNPDDAVEIERWVKRQQPDGIVCANDRTAGHLLRSLRALHYHVPDDILLVGIDDVEYARLLPVPLTTVRQPTLEIGDAALTAMLERIARPALPPREIRLPSKLIVRESSSTEKKSADRVPVT